MNHLTLSIPTATLLGLAIVSAASRHSAGDPKEAGSSPSTPAPVYRDGAQDACVERWDEMLRLFDRGDQKQIRLGLYEGAAKGAADQGAAQSAGNVYNCLSSATVAFLEGPADSGTETVTGPDAILERLCAIWPPLVKDEFEAGRRSRITKTLVLDDGLGRKVLLLTVERPATAQHDEKAIFFVTSIECGSGHSTYAARRGTLRSSASAATFAKKVGSGELVHLHISTSS